MTTQLPLVIQLQQLAADNSTEITELLRKALLVATKLGLQPLRDWVYQELHGYDTQDDIPEYRHVHAALNVRDPYQGLIPFLLEDREFMDRVCNVPTPEPVGSLVDLMRNQHDDNYTLTVPFSPEQKMLLMKILREAGYTPLEPVRTISRGRVAAILDVVRTKILEWSLQLEADGVMGEAMTFSTEEKRRAESGITIEHFQGILGNVSNSTVIQSSQMIVRKGDFGSLRSFLLESGVSTEDVDDLEEAVDAGPGPTSPGSWGENVNSWVGKMVSKAAAGTWQIGIGTAASFA